MKLIAYSVFDSKSGVYSTPYFYVNDATAIRAFTLAVNDERSNINAFPGDYTLYKIGDFDDNVAILSQCNPIPICNAVSVHRPKVSMVQEEVAKVLKPVLVDNGQPC